MAILGTGSHIALPVTANIAHCLHLALVLLSASSLLS